MKRLLFILMATFVAAPLMFAREQSLLARITVYWGFGAESQRASSNGVKLHSGHCAVDPRKIPYGSSVVFPDATCVAVDSGPAVVNRTAARKCGKTEQQRNALVIDRYFETKKQALAWAAENPHFMMVRVLDPQNQPADAKKSRKEKLAATEFGPTDASDRAMDARHGKRYSPDNDIVPMDIVASLLPTFFGASLPRS